MRRVFLALAIAGYVGFAGEVFAGSVEETSAPGLPESDRALIVGIAGDVVTFTWESKKGNTYFIVYADRTAKNAMWIAPPSLQNLQGTGVRETVTMKIPNAQNNRYSLRVLVPKSRLKKWFD